MEYKLGSYLVRTRGFACFSFWKASANSGGENSLVKEEPLEVGIFQSSEVSFLTSLVVSQSFVSYSPFRISCKKMAFAEIGHWRGGCLEWPVRLLNGSCPTIRVGKVNGLDSFVTSTSSFFVKFLQQGRSSPSGLWSIRSGCEVFVEAFTLLTPAWGVVASTST